MARTHFSRSRLGLAQSSFFTEPDVKSKTSKPDTEVDTEVHGSPEEKGV